MQSTKWKLLFNLKNNTINNLKKLSLAKYISNLPKLIKTIITKIFFKKKKQHYSKLQHYYQKSN